MEQRHGRIDRCDQKQAPVIYCLQTLSPNKKIMGDLCTLERLIEQERGAYKNIGDATTILGLYDAQEEEKGIEGEVVEQQRPGEINPDQPPADDGLSITMRGAEKASIGYADNRVQVPSPYKDDSTCMQSSFEELYTSRSPEQMPEFHP
jgi:hypothetical protein